MSQVPQLLRCRLSPNAKAVANPSPYTVVALHADTKSTGRCFVQVMAQSAVDRILLGPKLVNDDQLFKTRVTHPPLDESQISVIIFLDYLPATGRVKLLNGQILRSKLSEMCGLLGNRSAEIRP